MNTFSHVPPGFRFHPTDEELVDYYLRKKISSRRIDLDIIRDVDLYKIEPWDLIELCRLGTEDQNEWYFFSHKDKKYPTGTRTNRATTAGFWKATGRDKAIYGKHDLVGMRKTLVFYKGRAPNGQKSDWIMHEYRLETDENGTPQEEGWVVCKVFKKRIATTQKMSAHQSICWYDDQISFLPEFDSPNQELDMKYRIHHDHFLQLPLLESPMAEHHRANMNHGSPSITHGEQTQQVYDQEQTILHNAIFGDNKDWNDQGVDQVVDWRVLDKFVANQLSHVGDGDTKQNNYHNGADASTSTSSYL